MKKGMIAVLFTALILVQAAAVFAEATTYMDPNSLTETRGGGVVRSNGLIAARTKVSCNVQVTTDPQDRYFLGTARKECVTKNSGNLFCQQKCFDKVKLIVLTGNSPVYGSNTRTFARFGCNMLDPSVVATGIKTASQCYFKIKDTCALTNVANSYCQMKCTQGGYSVCRHNIADMRYV